MKRKRGMGKRKPVRAPVAVASDPYLSMGYQEAADSTTLADLNNTEFNYGMDAKTLQANSNMIGWQLGIEKQVVNEGDVNNANSLRKANIAVFSGNPSKRDGRISTNAPLGFGSSSINPNHDAALAQGERTFQEEPSLPQQDPQYNVKELNASLLVIKIIMGTDEAEPFNVPVDPIALGIPDYFDVIDTPMDFGTICKNLENGVKYVNSEDVFKDVQLVWENCSKYNKKGNYVLELMKRVKTNFMKFWAAAKLYMEPPQATNGYSHLKPHTASNMTPTKGGKECLVDQMSTSLLLSHQPSSICNRKNLSLAESNQMNGKLGPGCPVGLDTDNSARQLQDQLGTSQVQSHRASSIHSQRDQNPTASSTKRSNFGRASPEGPNTGNPACQLQDQMTLSPIQSHQPSLIFSRRLQPPRSCNQPQASLQQPDTSSNELQASLRETDTSSSQSHDSLQEHEANDASTSKKQRNTRGRGPTRCLYLWNTYGKRIHITTNEFGQPVGDETPKLTSFLGTLARDGLKLPLTYSDWRAMPNENKEKMWQEVESKFNIEPMCKDWVMKSLCTKWRSWKANLKIFHYNKHSTDEERLADRDQRVLPDQWAALVSYWSSAEGEARSAKNKANRAKQIFQHTSGKKSFARVREEERAKRADGKEPSVSELFVLTRTRKDGRPVNEASAAVISQLQETSDNRPNNQDEILSGILGQDRRGRTRLAGLGPTHGLGPTPSNHEGFIPRAEATRMVSDANSEVCEMKERMVAMEQNYAQMATQMSTVVALLSSMQRSTDRHQSNFATDAPDSSVGAPQQQVRSSTSRFPVSHCEARASKRSKMQDASATTKDA